MRQGLSLGVSAVRGVPGVPDVLPLILLHLDAEGPWIDSSLSAKTVTENGSIGRDTTSKKFGASSAIGGNFAASLQVDGDSTFYDLGGAWCIDYWVRIGAASANGVRSFALGTRVLHQFARSGANVTLTSFTDGGNAMAASSTFAVDTWTHIAQTWDGSTRRLFVGGNVVGSDAINGSASPTPLYVAGHQGQAGLESTNNLDEFRIVKGSAVWTSTFTPPGAPY